MRGEARGRTTMAKKEPLSAEDFEIQLNRLFAGLMTRKELEAFVRRADPRQLKEIDRALAETTGFDALKARKAINQRELKEYMKLNPEWTAVGAARHLGLAPKTVYLYLKEMGISTRPQHTKETKIKNLKKLRHLLDENPQMTRPMMSKALGVSDRTIGQYLKDLRRMMAMKTDDYNKLWKEPRKGGTQAQQQKKKEDLMRMARSFKEHPQMTNAERAKYLGISTTTYKRHLREMKKGGE